MNKTEFIAAIAAQAGLKNAEAAKALKAVTDTITAELAKGEKIQLTGFGTFSVKERAARIGRNPQTGKEIEIKASKVPAFAAGKLLKDAVK